MAETKCDAHGFVACSRCTRISDEARRITDFVNLMIALTPWDVLTRSCLAFRLDDGSTDGVLYSNRRTALTHQLRPCLVFYFRNCMGGVNPKDMQIFLSMNRFAYESDRTAWIDPDSPDFIISTRSGDILRGKG